MRPSSLLSILSCALLTITACSSGGDEIAESEGHLEDKESDEWFYNGPMPTLEESSVTLALEGHTVRVTGKLPLNATLPSLPHVKTKTLPDGRTLVDAVYPIATANPANGKVNQPPDTYHFTRMVMYRPKGIAVTKKEGRHTVTWGGFPFLSYTPGGDVALHGPITPRDGAWFLQRGKVSGGCNRMLGEHVVELAHLVGAPMDRLYDVNKGYTSSEAPISAPGAIRVIAGYDEYDGKKIDVDYPTASGMQRPGKVFGDENVVMFGTWVGSESPDGTDLPPPAEWEGGVKGKLFVFQEHVLPNAVCSVAPGQLRKLSEVAAKNGGRVPNNLCSNRACWVGALSQGADAAIAKCGTPAPAAPNETPAPSETAAPTTP
jgi:hypothetical protein